MRLTILTALLLVLTGCATPSPMEERFGDSVRLMTEQQRYTPPNAQREPSALDGNKAAAILEAYRQDVAKPQESRDEIRIRVGR